MKKTFEDIKYLYTIPYQNKFIVYRPLKKIAFIANAAMVNLIERTRNIPPENKKADSSANDFLASIGWFEPDPQIPFTVANPNFYSPEVAILFLTTRCNFRCIYCYASGGESKIVHMPIELGRRAIDIVCHNAIKAGQDYFTLGFHGGGEPTLAVQNFKETINYAKKKELPCKINVASNGYWTASYRRWILGNVDEISLSFDGIKSVHNHQRPLSSGAGSYDRVYKTINELDRKNFSYGIRLTVTDESIPYLVKSIIFLCRNTECNTFQVEPAFNHGRAKKNGYSLKQIKSFASAFMEAYDITISFKRHMYYSGARPWVITDRFCQAPEKALIVGPNGFLTSCYEIYSKEHSLSEDFIFGRLSARGNLEINKKRRHRFFNKINQRREQCKNCFCYWHCAGDCPSKTFPSNTENSSSMKERCELNRIITKELLIRYIESGNGVWQGEIEDFFSADDCYE